MNDLITIELDVEPVKEEYIDEYLVIRNGWGVYDYCIYGEEEIRRILNDYMFMDDYILYSDYAKKFLSGVPENTKHIRIEMEITISSYTSYYQEGEDYELEFDWTDEKITYE